MGSIEDCFDNAVIESFWARVQVELLNRQRWRTRIELANAIFEYLEVFHNRQRRHSALGMRTPIEYERIHHDNPTAAPTIQASRLHKTRGTSKPPSIPGRFKPCHPANVARQTSPTQHFQLWLDKGASNNPLPPGWTLVRKNLPP